VLCQGVKNNCDIAKMNSIVLATAVIISAIFLLANIGQFIIDVVSFDSPFSLSVRFYKGV